MAKIKKILSSLVVGVVGLWYILTLTTYTVAGWQSYSLIRSIEQYHEEYNNYPEIFSAIIQEMPSYLNYEVHNEGDVYFLSFRNPFWPFEYRYESMYQSLHGGLYRYLENKLSLYLKPKYFEAKSKNDFKRAVFIARINFIAAVLSRDFHDVKVANAYKYIANAYFGLNKPKAVESNLKKSEAFYLKSYIPDDSGLFDLYCDFGAFYLHRGRFDESAENYNKALTMANKYSYMAFPRNAEAISGVAENYILHAELPKAREMYRQIIDSNQFTDEQKSLGWKGLGDVSSNEFEFEKAEEYYQKSLNYLEDQNGQAAAQLKARLGLCYSSRGEHEKAQTALMEAMEIYKRYPEFNKTQLLDLKQTLAISALSEGDEVKGNRLLNELIDEYQKTYGDGTPFLATPYFTLAVQADQKKDYQTAENFYKKALQIHEKNNSELQGILIWNTLAKMYKDINKNKEARAAYEKVMSLLIRRDGKDAESVKLIQEKIDALPN